MGNRRKPRRTEERWRRAARQKVGIGRTSTDPRDWLTKYNWIGENRLLTLGAQRRAYQMVLNTHLKPGDRVVEVGSGGGWFQEHIVPGPLKQGWIEVDTNPAALAVSPGGKRIGGSIFRLPFKKGSVDAIVDCSCIQGFRPEDHARIVSEFGRVLKPGGKVLSFQDAIPEVNIWGNKTLKGKGGRVFRDTGGTKLDGMIREAHDRFSQAFSNSLSSRGFRILERGPVLWEEKFREEPRHSRFSIEVEAGGPEVVKRFREAPVYIYRDGSLTVKGAPDLGMGIIPPGYKMEVFQGRAIVAQKPEATK
jgi:SAM-dependent methyltransferase